MTCADASNPSGSLLFPSTADPGRPSPRDVDRSHTHDAELPTHLHYTVEHEWLDDGAPATVGITAIAADALGDIVYLELPAVGEEITAGAVVGEIESTKSVSELYSPVSGTVVEVNQAAVDDPSVVNSDPYGRAGC